MKNYWQKIGRLGAASTLVTWVVGLSLWGCAAAPGPAAAREAPVAPAPNAAPGAAEPRDPFAVAAQWAAALVDPAAPPHGAGAKVELAAEIAEITASWTTAQVSRIWAVGPEYRALIIQRSTTEQRPAVLLHISAAPNGAWRVTGLSPATTTDLWSQL